MERHAMLADAALLDRVGSIAADLRRDTAELVGLLAEVDARGLHLGLGHSSLFAYCIERLRMSEGEAANRIAAARAARRYPAILDLLAQGRVTLTTIRLLAPHLTEDNHAAVLTEACGLTRPQVEVLVARLAPRPPLASALRPVAVAALPVAALPVPAASQPPTPTVPPVAPRLPTALVVPLAPQLFRLSVTMTSQTRSAWEQARVLVEGDDARVLERVLALALPALQQRKTGSGRRRRQGRRAHPDSRHVPAETRRVVWDRDGGRCAFVGTDGHRCTATRHLQFHHVRPYAAGGAMTPDNIELRCPAHNRYEAKVFFAAAHAGRAADAVPGATERVPEHVDARLPAPANGVRARAAGRSRCSRPTAWWSSTRRCTRASLRADGARAYLGAEPGAGAPSIAARAAATASAR